MGISHRAEEHGRTGALGWLPAAAWAPAALGLALLATCLLFGLVPATALEPETSPQPPGGRSTGSQLVVDRVAWEPWSAGTFARAAREDKLVFLDLTAVWCHACHVMEETTYRDPAVVALLNRRFVPIQVDTDRRPDIDARYRQGGWPTTSVLLPSGEILFQANFLEAEELRLALQESEAHYRAHRAELTHQAQSVWAAVEAALKHRPASASPIDRQVVPRSVALLKARFDPEHGGFGQSAKFIEPEAVSFALAQAYWSGHDDLERMALATLEAQRRLVDPVRGGFYRYAENADWSNPHSEKLLEVQAVALGNYLEAYGATGEGSFRSVAEQVIVFVNRVLLSPERDAFYASQAARTNQVRAAGLRPSSGARPGSAEAPLVDRAVYTASNALIAGSYLQAALVLDRADLRDQALRVLSRLLRERYHPGRGVARLSPDHGGEPLILLPDQVALGRSLLEAFLVTGERWYLDGAERVAGDLVARFGDPAGGFYDRPRSAEDEAGLLRFPQMPPRENLRAVLLLTDLAYVTAQQRYRDHAERTLRVLLGRGETLPVALVGLAVDRFVRYPLHIVVIGARREPGTEGLLVAAHRAYAPGKIVRVLDPGRDRLALGEVSFPRTEEPTAYVCTDRYCSKPTTDARELPARIETVRQALSALPVAH